MNKRKQKDTEKFKKIEGKVKKEKGFKEELMAKEKMNKTGKQRQWRERKKERKKGTRGKRKKR